ncbi:hypothetical protein A9Q96_16285 [Rhodobacterales bacterium 52_120_T64]|nr:hypothetical protein A9Q96_16285 [Rhodobacterales bacterium 52_120_T64]
MALTQRGQKKLRDFEERKAAFIGLLEAYHRAAIEDTDEAGKNFALWQMRCEIVAPMSVREAIAKIIDTNDDRSRRATAHERLKEVMREDLNVSK